MLRKTWGTLPVLVRFMLSQFANGVAMGWSFGLMVIWLDLGGFGTLLARVDSAALTALFFANGGLLFGTTAASVAIMSLGDD
ncbi:MAG: hypothetical protein Q7J44_00600 [Pseudotabrizicola sp.]|uniref:hypothetical protein n=1 Tax=Pseudotabrizicola sp. TaxID=2939647 RepID=UPI0027166F0A|nr:hypothetical protein [Pseudotabrizicola sp.]MDO9637021.1 hypothetical protein [Pseudotabrizicola sp.]